MVTPARPLPPRLRRLLRARPLHRAARAAVLALLPALWLLLSPGLAAAQGGTLYFLSAKAGVTDATGSGENLFQTLEPTHGKLKNPRDADLYSLELDIYGVSSAAAGLGLGVDLQGYRKVWELQDGETIYMRTFGVLFTLKTFLRLGDWYPFVGLGMGNYFVNYRQTNAKIAFRDSPSSVYTGRVGLRVLMGRLGLLAETGRTRAMLPVATDVGTANLELGGRFTSVGLSWVF